MRVVIENRKELSRVIAQHNQDHEQILDLQITNNLKLENLTDLEFQDTCTFISKCLNLQSCGLQDVNIRILSNMYRLQPLFGAICKCLNLESLNFFGLNIENAKSKDVQAISNVIFNCSKLKSLNLAWSQIYTLEFTDIQMILNAIAISPNLQVLDLMEIGLDKLDTSCFKVLCETICKCQCLKVFESDQSELDRLNQAHFDMLCDAIYKSHSIEYCDFKFKQSNMRKERNQRIAYILQNKRSLLEKLEEREKTSECLSINDSFKTTRPQETTRSISPINPLLVYQFDNSQQQHLTSNKRRKIDFRPIYCKMGGA
jgi:hypothetical protein